MIFKVDQLDLKLGAENIRISDFGMLKFIQDLMSFICFCVKEGKH